MGLAKNQVVFVNRPIKRVFSFEQGYSVSEVVVRISVARRVVLANRERTILAII